MPDQGLLELDGSGETLAELVHYRDLKLAIAAPLSWTFQAYWLDRSSLDPREREELERLLVKAAVRHRPS